MNTILLIIFGFLAGIVGGMGMGGGTVLVPLISFLDLPQKTIQAINLISFLPMCLVALCVHGKRGLLKPKNILYVVGPAVVFALIGALVAGDVQNKLLRIVFALFLIVVGTWQLVVAIKFQIRKSKRRIVVQAKTYRLLAKGRNPFYSAKRVIKQKSTTKCSRKI